MEKYKILKSYYQLKKNMLNFKEKIKEEVFMSTPHNQANKGDIAKTVLMPGDPLRAKYLAETYLENVKQFNATRSMFGYTGTYKGKEVSIMGSGMGMPSIGIYSYELFHFYDVENIIRIGSCGSFKEDVHLRDIIIVQGDYSLLEKAVEKAKEKNLTYHVGNVLSSDLFYHADNKADKWIKMGCLATEMESYALFANAAYAGKKALTLLTVSDSLVRHPFTLCTGFFRYFDTVHILQNRFCTFSACLKHVSDLCDRDQRIFFQMLFDLLFRSLHIRGQRIHFIIYFYNLFFF